MRWTTDDRQTCMGPFKYLDRPYWGFGCASRAAVRTLYCHFEILGSIPGQSEIFMKNSISATLPAHSAVMSRPGLYLVEGKAARE